MARLLNGLPFWDEGKFTITGLELAVLVSIGILGSTTVTPAVAK